MYNKNYRAAEILRWRALLSVKNFAKFLKNPLWRERELFDLIRALNVEESDEGYAIEEYGELIQVVE